MMRLKIAGAVAAAAAVFLVAPSAGRAHPHGHGGLHGHHAFHGAWPWYGGYVALPPGMGVYAGGYGQTLAPLTVKFVPEPPRALSCHRSRQTVKVPAQDGGSSEITVTRC
jgi:hypothetical protein